MENQVETSTITSNRSALVAGRNEIRCSPMEKKTKNQVGSQSRASQPSQWFIADFHPWKLFNVGRLVYSHISLIMAKDLRAFLN